MSKIPRLRLPDGSIFEPTLRYFAYGWLNKIFKAKSSMEPDSYSIREWLCHHTNLGLDWKAAGTDDSFRSFRTSFAQSVEDGELSATQVELKLDHVFKFYRNIRKAMPFVGLMPTPQFVGKPANLTPSPPVSPMGKSGGVAGAKLIEVRPTDPRPTSTKSNESSSICAPLR